jgi:hypothetical protein
MRQSSGRQHRQQHRDRYPPPTPTPTRFPHLFAVVQSGTWLPCKKLQPNAALVPRGYQVCNFNL